VSTADSRWPHPSRFLHAPPLPRACRRHPRLANALLIGGTLRSRVALLPVLLALAIGLTVFAADVEPVIELIGEFAA